MHHINQLNMYVNDYITNILIGNSLNGITQNFISELKAVKPLPKVFQIKAFFKLLLLFIFIFLL